jgi:hypothetical protein
MGLPEQLDTLEIPDPLDLKAQRVFLEVLTIQVLRVLQDQLDSQVQQEVQERLDP